MEIEDFELPSTVKIKVESQEEAIKIRKCAVATCYNVSTRKDLMFHKFPKNKRIREMWIKLCGRTDKISGNCALICSDHFKANQYTRGLKDFALAKGHQIKLIPESIPDINLPNIKMIPNTGDHPTEFEESDTLSEDSRTLSPLNNKSSNVEEDEDSGTFFPLNNKNNNSGEDENVLMQDGCNQEEDKPTPPSLPWQQTDTVTSTPICDLTASPEKIVELDTENTDDDNEIITVISSEEDDDDDDTLMYQTAHRTGEESFLSLLEDKYQTLEKNFHELMINRNKEIGRLNTMIEYKEEEFSRELKEILTLFLKPANVAEIVSQVMW